MGLLVPSPGWSLETAGNRRPRGMVAARASGPSTELGLQARLDGYDADSHQLSALQEKGRYSLGGCAPERISPLFRTLSRLAQLGQEVEHGSVEQRGGLHVDQVPGAR